MKRVNFRILLLSAALIFTLMASTVPFSVAFADGDCIPDGGIDDTGGRTHCCSGEAVPGSTYCLDKNRDPDDYSSCTQICGSSVE